MNFVQYFDDKMINVLYAVSQISIAITFILIHSVYKKVYLTKITIGFVLNAVGISLITLRQFIPDFFSILIGNVLLLVSVYIIYDAMVEMIKLKGHIRMLLISCLIFALAHSIFTYISPDVRYRIINFSVFSMFGAVYLIYEYVIGMIKSYKHIFVVIIITHIGFILIEGARIYNALADESMEILFSNANMLKYYILYSILISITRAISVILYNTKDLVRHD